MMSEEVITADLCDEACIASMSPKDLQLIIPCGVCDRDTVHTKLVYALTKFEHPGTGFERDDYYFTVQCCGCTEISFYHLIDDSEGQTQRIYPNRVSGRRLLPESFLIPEGVCRIYRETHSAITSSLSILAAIGIRAIVEAVCKESEAAGDNLKARITRLKELGIVTAFGETTLHGLRFMGNSAAHEVAAHPMEHLSIAFDVVEHILSEVYILPKKAKKFVTEDS